MKLIDLPAGTAVLERERATGTDVGLALELADLGASRTLIEAVGGAGALRELGDGQDPQPTRPVANPA